VKQETAQRYVVSSPRGLAVHADAEGSGQPLALLPQGTILLCAELQDDKAGQRRMRISAPSGWVDTIELEEAPPPPSFALSWPEFEGHHLQQAPGDHYGIPFPINHAQFEEMGPAFLTQAFRATGDLSPRNEVLQIDAYHRIDGGGASVTAAFDVRYADDTEAAPPKQLFVKMPAADVKRKFVSSYMLFGETEFSRLSVAGTFPIPVSRYVFGDYCQRTANGILITERIPFGEEPIEKAHLKGLDALLPDADDHYRALNALLAQIVGFHKRGGFGPHLEEVFPFRRGGSVMPAVASDGLIDFITARVPHLLPQQMTSEAFLARFKADADWILDHLRELSAALNKNVDYTGFCHANLNLDNAWFWRNQEGSLQAGLLDWGAAGQMSLGQAFYGMLFASDPAKMLPLRRELVNAFIVDYHGASGIQLDPEALLQRAKVACLITLPMIVFASEQFVQNYAKMDLGAIEGLADPRVVADSGFQTMFAMLGNILTEWFDKDMEPVETCRALLTEDVA
jgi:hypothetical protein